MLVTLLSLGSSSAFNAFLNVGIIGVDLSYGLPIFISLLDRRRTVSSAPYNMGWIGVGCNVITTAWVAFSLVLFCMVSAFAQSRQQIASRTDLDAAHRHTCVSMSSQRSNDRSSFVLIPVSTATSANYAPAVLAFFSALIIQSVYST